SPEFLQQSVVDVTEVPPHNLALKVGCVVMFVRDVDFALACGIGAKVLFVLYRFESLVQRWLQRVCVPLVKIPRNIFEAKVGRQDLIFHRQQFPLMVCYAMTINKKKRQGQTLERVGLDLRSDVF
ncbi:unnamed protein product, partial [Hapterophycus canaliculatus]